MATFVHDVRVAARSMVGARGFAVTAVLTLALGMALCIVAVAVMKAYLFQELPYPAAGRLYSVSYGVPGQPQPREMEGLDWASLGDVSSTRWPGISTCSTCSVANTRNRSPAHG
jgi:hypothetical protein